MSPRRRRGLPPGCDLACRPSLPSWRAPPDQSIKASSSSNPDGRAPAQGRHSCDGRNQLGEPVSVANNVVQRVPVQRLTAPTVPTTAAVIRPTRTEYSSIEAPLSSLHRRTVVLLMQRSMIFLLSSIGSTKVACNGRVDSGSMGLPMKKLDPCRNSPHLPHNFSTFKLWFGQSTSSTNLRLRASKLHEESTPPTDRQRRKAPF